MSSPRGGGVEFLLRTVWLGSCFLVQPPERIATNNNSVFGSTSSSTELSESSRGGTNGMSSSEGYIGTEPLCSRKVWMVVRDFRSPSASDPKQLVSNRYVLHEGDIIKLGRFKMRVRQLCKGPVDALVRPDACGDGVMRKLFRLYFFQNHVVGSVAPVSESDFSPSHLGENGQHDPLPVFSCRVCLLDGSGDDEEDPLIQACSCRGSIRYIHLNCLRHWINGRLSLNDPVSGLSRYTYLFKQLTCELCKASYPLYVRLNQKPPADGGSIPASGRLLPLFPMPETKAPFIVLENLMRPVPPPGEQPPADTSSRGDDLYFDFFRRLLCHFACWEEAVEARSWT
jgi:hypothetical protein